MLIDLNALYSLSSQAAIVTGGAQGMGEQISRFLAGMGASVAVADINAAGAEEVAAAIVAEGGIASSFHVDMGDEASVVALVDGAHAAFGRVDILVNVAGLSDRNNLADTTADFWDRIHDVNLRGPFIAIREAMRHMRADGIRGRIVNIASHSAFHAVLPSLFAYSTSKAGVVGLTRAAAMEGVGDGIRVNAVCPGNTATPGQMQATGPAFTADVIAKFMPPIGRAGTPTDIASAVLFLVSEASAFVTGQALVVDGGMLTC